MSSNSTTSRPRRSTDMSGGPPDCAIVRALDFEIERSDQGTCCPGLPSLDVRCDGYGRVSGVLVSEQMTRADGSGIPHGGPLPDSIGRLDQVYVIWAYGNNLSGEIPRSLDNLRGLQDLNLSKNNLAGSIPDIFSDKPLTYLNLSNNNLTGPVPPLPYMSSGCVITSYASTERNKFTCLAGDPLNHKGACYDNLRPAALQPCTPHGPPVAHDVPPDTQQHAPPPPAFPLPTVMVVLISMSATTAFVSLVALGVFATQQRRRRRRLEASTSAAAATAAPAPAGKGVVYAKLPAGAEQGHVYAAVQRLSAEAAGPGLVFVVPKHQAQRGRGDVMVVPTGTRQTRRREEEELFLPQQEEVDIPELFEIGERA